MRTRIALLRGSAVALGLFLRALLRDLVEFLTIL